MKVTNISRALLVALAMAGASMLPSVNAQNGPDQQIAASAPVAYFVYFKDAGAAKYQGGIHGLAKTATEQSGTKFDAKRAEVVSYRAHLAELQDGYITDFEQTLGRELQVDYRFDVLFSGVVGNLSAAEAASLAQHPAVERVAIVEHYELATDRGPTFIGANTIWTGTSTGTAGYRGQGTVIGVLDTGVNSSHPSFANDASCGFSAANPKLLAAKDCLGSATCTGPTPVDNNGHGSHTASTAGGNGHAATGGAMAGTQISGIAPCAQLITYKVCATSSCDGAAIQAAIQTALIDQVDVVNYSISGGTSPWTDADRGFLDLVDAGTFVAASAGNTSAAITNPVAQVNHRGPWVMTVANSFHDRVANNGVSIAGGVQNQYGLKSASTAPFTVDINAQVAPPPVANPIGCTAGGGIPAGSMTGKIGVVMRGTCPFEEKINNAIGAGAIAVIVGQNNAGPPIVMGVGTGTANNVVSVMVSQANANAIIATATGNPTAQGTIVATTLFQLDPTVGDVLSSSSLRGPIGGGIEVTKPDITGPGTNIMAAFSGAANSYAFLSGTSMSGPHVAGSGALVMGLRRTWTVPEVRSAIMMTAKPDGLKDFQFGVPNNGPWDADDVGHGRVDLTKAALSGLVMHETTANFLGANGNVANQRALNVPSMRNAACPAGQSCQWTRTLRNTVNQPTNWTVTVENGPSVNLVVSPLSFNFNGVGVPGPDTLFANGFENPVAPETVMLTITANPALPGTTAFRFAKVVLTETNGRSPPLRLTVAVLAQ